MSHPFLREELGQKKAELTERIKQLEKQLLEHPPREQLEGGSMEGGRGAAWVLAARGSVSGEKRDPSLID